MIHILALSFSSTWAVNSGQVSLWPIGFNIKAYENMVTDTQFFISFWTSSKRVILGLVTQMTMVVLAGYPLSKTKAQFPMRQFFAWFFVFTMLFGAGLIPTYLVVAKTGLLNTIWALIIPGAVPVYYTILMQNFIKELPAEISESAYIDGAGQWRVLLNIVLPLCKPALAAISLFIMVGHWNEWFGGLVYMNNPRLYPLQTYLRTKIVNIERQLDVSMTYEDLAARTAAASNRAAQMFLAMIPALIVYPFLQRHFTKGIVSGSVKG